MSEENDIVTTLRECAKDSRANAGDYYADQFSTSDEVFDCAANEIESLREEIARLREERRRREEVWLACAEETRLVYGGFFMPKPLPLGAEVKEVGRE